MWSQLKLVPVPDDYELRAWVKDLSESTFRNLVILIGLAYLYATTGTADLLAARRALQGAGATLPLAIPILLLLGGLAVRAGVTRRVVPLEGVLIPLVLVLVLTDVAVRRWPR